MRKILIFIGLSITLFSCSLKENERNMVRKGNIAYKDSIYDKAEVLYRKALEHNPHLFAAQYNLANATYQQKHYKSAINKYKQLLDSLETIDFKSATNHNMGNSYLHAKKIDEAIAAYKEALRNNPNDKETKYNLVYAMNLKQQQQQQQQQNKQDQQQNKDQKEDRKSQQDTKPKDGDKEKKAQPKTKEEDDSDKDENQDKKEDADKKEGNKEKDEKGESKEHENKEGNDENGEKEKITPVGLSKEDAENILDAIALEEKESQKKVQKEKARKQGVVRKKKNW